MRYEFIEAHRQEFPTRLMCRVLEVSTGGHHERRHRPPSAREERSEALARSSIFEFIEVFYIRVRRHSSLRYRSPVEHERAG